MNKTLRMKVARYVTAAFPNMTKALKEAGVIWDEDASDADNAAEERLVEQFLREAATAVLFVADQDEKRLTADRTHGEYREAVEKLVDGVVEDIRGCKYTWKWDALAALTAAVAFCEYATDPALHIAALTHGTHASAYLYNAGRPVTGPGDRVPWQKMAAACVFADAREELENRPEFNALPSKGGV